MTQIISSDRYTNVFMLGHECYGSMHGWKSEVLNNKIEAVHFLRISTGDKMETLAGAGVGGIVGGFVGAIVGATVMRPRIDAVVDVYLKDGEKIRLKTKKRDLVNYLASFIEGDEY